jgi:hypothetical protein
MCRRWRMLCLVVMAAASALVLGAEEDSSEALERNADLLSKWKADTDHYSRLRRDLKAFYALPAPRRARLRQFDRELHALDLGKRRRLWDVLYRYNAWLERLPEADHRRINDIGGTEDRLTAIRELRDKQWLARLPAKEREELESALKAQPDRWTSIVTKYKNEERQRKAHHRDPLRQKLGTKDK